MKAESSVKAESTSITLANSVLANSVRRDRASHSRARPPELEPQAQDQLKALLQLDAASGVNDQLQQAEVAALLDRYRVMCELLKTASSAKTEAAQARRLVRAHAMSEAWQVHLWRKEARDAQRFAAQLRQPKPASLGAACQAC